MPKGKKKRGFLWRLTCILVALILVLAGTYLACDQFDVSIPVMSDWFSGTATEGTLAKDEVRVHQINVGQGDSTLIQTAETTILIDAGDVGYGDTVVQYLQKQQITTIDLLIITHPHADHIGGMTTVVEQLEIGRVLLPNLPSSLTPTTATYEKLLSAISTKGLMLEKAVAGSTITLADCSLEIFAPVGSYDDLNSYSIAGRFSANGFTFFFGGDIEADAEEDILANYSDLTADVMKVSHHGSNTSNTEEFLEAVSPKYALISVGQDNSYGHPHEEVLERLEALGIRVYRTDTDGNIMVDYLDGDITILTNQ